MRLTAFPLLVASSLLWSAGSSAAVRPHYGGILHVEMRAAPASLDPADSNQSDWFGFRDVCTLMFETLVSLDEQGKPQPGLASSWQAEPGSQRWQFFLRRGITFQDGTLVTPDAVAASLRRTNPTWKVFAEGEAVIIERDSAAPDLPAELSLVGNSIESAMAERFSVLDRSRFLRGIQRKSFLLWRATTIGVAGRFWMQSKSKWARAFGSR